MVVHYNYCPDATTDPTTGATQPCERTTFGDGDASLLNNQVDYNDPCATGGCLLSPECTSGLCRLAQLGGRWACCACGGRANEQRWCRQRPPASPDTFCYHP
ncbi:f20513cf-f3a1-40d5-a72e-6fe5cc121e85 [Thermothielavioides terrestris]|uniref:F20513cf-f3a1-40d5-a72e-6fe5cc121e85 n=1 Tax=Thermothielavioides terrestris TaxID=2587410 RepID=A0A3S5CWL7_9PEZI|nr:f20513cf-f3a1-40d5-a72e-6fe5cc121e85 [Thermothielavioides terrestris]